MKKLLLLALLPLTAMATPIKGINETYQDWDLACDNTGTCRMAGYQSAELDKPTSILFTRKAGDFETVSAELSFHNFDEENDKEIPIAKTTEIFLDGQSLGTVVNHNDSTSTLSQAQTVALLKALKKSSKIEVVSGQFKGEVSDKGAAAAMLKMDEFQQRLNKPSALMRKGENKAATLSPQPAPKIHAVKISNRKEYNLERGSVDFDKVMALLRQSNGNENSDNYCSELHNDDYSGNDSITLYSLTNGKVLAQAVCFMGAYQGTSYHAVMDDKLTKVEQVLALKYQEAGYDEKEHFLDVGSAFKGRGIGDCYGGDTAVWNGKIFVRTSEWSTGSCKGFPGGAWSLPTFVSEVVVK